MSSTHSGMNTATSAWLNRLSTNSIAIMLGNSGSPHNARNPPRSATRYGSRSALSGGAAVGSAAGTIVATMTAHSANVAASSQIAPAGPNQKMSSPPIEPPTSIAVREKPS